MGTALQTGVGGDLDLFFLKQYNPMRETADWLVANIIFSLVFIIVVNVLFMNAIFGTIVDVFGKLREEKAFAVQLKLSVCHICSLSRQQMERKALTSDFDQHKEYRHNLLAYVRFIFYIRSKNPNQLTGAEHYVMKQLE